MAVTAAPSWQQLRTQFVGYAVSVRPAVNFFTGGIADMIAGAVASVADRVVAYMAEGIRDTFLDGAADETLTTLAADHWNVQRTAGSRATAILTLTRASGALPGTIPAGTEVRTQNDALGRSLVYRTDVDLAWVAELAQTVPATAASIGTDYNVAIGKITRVVTGLFDAFTVTNTATAAGGAAAQTDDELRAAVRAKPLSYRRGTLSALEYGALLVAGVANAVATEDATGLVTIYVADGSGGSNGTMTGLATIEMRNWAAAGAAWQVLGGTLLEPALSLVVYTRPGFGDELIAPIQAAVAARMTKLRVGELLWNDMAEQAAMNVCDGIRRVDVLMDGLASASYPSPAVPTALVRPGFIAVTIVAEAT